MKLTETVIELMFELSNIEGVKVFESDTTQLRNSLLELYNSTDNPDAHDIIIDIMSAAGYPWFENVARVEREGQVAITAAPRSAPSRVMSDDDFMDLIPANGHLH